MYTIQLQEDEGAARYANQLILFGNRSYYTESVWCHLERLRFEVTCRGVFEVDVPAWAFPELGAVAAIAERLTALAPSCCGRRRVSMPEVLTLSVANGVRRSAYERDAFYKFTVEWRTSSFLDRDGATIHLRPHLVLFEHFIL